MAARVKAELAEAPSELKFSYALASSATDKVEALARGASKPSGLV